MHTPQTNWCELQGEHKIIEVVIGLVATAAIIFSGTVGTLSSVSAFADAQARSLQYQRPLAQLQQLHWRVGNDVFATTNLCSTGANPDLQKEIPV